MPRVHALLNSLFSENDAIGVYLIAREVVPAALRTTQFALMPGDVLFNHSYTAYGLEPNYDALIEIGMTESTERRDNMPATKRVLQYAFEDLMPGARPLVRPMFVAEFYGLPSQTVVDESIDMSMEAAIGRARYALTHAVREIDQDALRIARENGDHDEADRLTHNPGLIGHGIPFVRTGSRA